MAQQEIHFFIEENPAHQRVVRLTDRQVEVLQLLCAGMPNKVISRRLGISSATVKVHVSSVLRALGVGTRLQAVVEAQARGLTERPGIQSSFGGSVTAEPSSFPHGSVAALG